MSTCLSYSSTLCLFSLFLSLLYYAIISISLSFPGEEKGLCLFSLLYFIPFLFHYHFTYYIYPFHYPFSSSHVPTFLLLRCSLLTPVLSPHWHFQSAPSCASPSCGSGPSRSSRCPLGDCTCATCRSLFHCGSA